MGRSLDAWITAEQLGALTRGAPVELESEGRRTVQCYPASSNSKVTSRVATTDCGDEYTVLSFPADIWEDVLETIGAKTDQDRIKLGSMIWLKRES